MNSARYWRPPLVVDSPKPVLQAATDLLALCDMRTLYIRNVPEEVGERLDRLAAREGLSVSAFVARELASLSRRVDNAALLGDLADVGVHAAEVLAILDSGRPVR